ncbi:MAG: aldose epimerase family protein [Akkermansiaceae bacterium]|jgi:aldose 1-epimerase
MMIRSSNKLFGKLPDGSQVTSWTMRNQNGMEVEILNYGAIVRRISFPHPDGDAVDVVLGFDDIDGYLQDSAWIGAVAGRVAGRISGGRFTLNGVTHQLPLNQPPNHLHGGPDSFNRKLWRGEVIEGSGLVSIRLVHLSPHGEQNYPGDVIVAVTYTLTDNDEMIFTTEAVSLDSTPVSITQHSYFNLAGRLQEDTRDHILGIFSDKIIPTNENHTLSDSKIPVAGTASDLRNPKRIRDMVFQVANQHLDFYWFGDAGESKHMARLFSPESGIQMDVFSTHDCLQAYSAMDMNGNVPGKSGRSHQAYSGVCLETEGYPNACDTDDFGSILTDPGKVQKHVTIYAFQHRGGGLQPPSPAR